jgi:hypothetical protein
MAIRRPFSAAVAAVTAVLLAGCAQGVAGTARPNEAEAQKARTAGYDAGITAFEEHFNNVSDEKSRAYYYVRYDDKSLDREVDAFFLGDPPAILSRISGKEDGDEFDKFHPAGADVDYARLGPKLAHLAPTPWVSEPTIYHKDLAVHPCMLDGISSACGLSKAIAQTKLESPDGLVKEARRNADGSSEVLTGITLETFLEFKVMIFSDELKKKFTPEMLNSVLPVRINFDADGRFSKFELRATVPGEPTQLQLQLGYEVKGTTEESDFPEPPKPDEVTALDKAASDKFWDDVFATQGK